MTELISKKELLQATGISYGQLYRWKRENLIPEDWFIKKSSFTGQETFFPKDKMLKRVEMIQGLKDTLSLEEIARLLSPELLDRLFGIGELEAIGELNSAVVKAFINGFRKNTFTYFDVLLILALSALKSEIPALTGDELQNIISGLKDWIGQVNGITYNLIIFECNNSTFAALNQSQAQFFLDSRLKILKVFHMDELANEFKLKYDRGIV